MRTPSVPGGDSRPLVIGLGNEHRGDDRCGLEVVRALGLRLGGEVRLVEGPEDVTELLALWADADRVIVIDAVRSGGTPGTIHRFELPGTELPSRLGATSTHGLTLADAVALARSLGRFPSHVTVFGIEAGPVEMSDGLSAPVVRAVGEVAEKVVAELRGSVARKGADQ
ncbi:MAG: hydrogenase maturation protease [Thermoplasmata archaeon]